MKRRGVLEWMAAKERILEKAVLLLATTYEVLEGEEFKKAVLEKIFRRLKENSKKHRTS